MTYNGICAIFPLEVKIELGKNQLLNLMKAFADECYYGKFTFPILPHCFPLCELLFIEK